MIGHNYRFNPLVMKMKRLLVSGKIGKPVSLSTRFAIPSVPADSWRTSRSSGGGALLDLAVHHVDLARFLLDAEPHSVTARIETRRTEHDFAHLMMHTNKGTTAEITVVFGEPFEDRIHLVGDEGALWMDRAHSPDVAFAAKGKALGPMSKVRAHIPSPESIAYIASRRRSPFREPSFEVALSAFVQAASGNISCKPDLDDGLAALIAVDAAERSAASGQPVTL
jgi:predicted dehydrogenase